MTSWVAPLPPGSGADFDALAAEFDRRRGVPVEVARRVAEVVLELVPRPDGWLVDLGAGTGEIGRHLRSGPLPVLALDLSLPMLGRYARRSAASPPGGAGRGRLVLADLDAPWPLPAGRAALVFASRVVHRLDPRRLLAELQRVTAPGARLVLGRVHRHRDNPGPRMRRELRRLLDQSGASGRRGDEATSRLVDALRGGGARADSPQVVAEWSDPETPGAALERWRTKVGLADLPHAPVELGGRSVSQHYAAGALDRLEAWARRQWPDLTGADTTRPARYELTVIHFPGE
jgi:SAM-dependent methyltransferase